MIYQGRNSILIRVNEKSDNVEEAIKNMRVGKVCKQGLHILKILMDNEYHSIEEIANLTGKGETAA